MARFVLYDPLTVPLGEDTLGYEVIHQGYQKQRVAFAVLVQFVRQGKRQGFGLKPRREVFRDILRREGCQGQFVDLGQPP